MEKFYITTAIDYVNASPHIGHALEKVQADVIARYQRLKGLKVFFLTGTDEHGTKILRASKEEGISTQEFCDLRSSEFKELARQLNISNDYFIRTTDKRHEKASQKLWLSCKKDIYKSKYRGYYCVGCEAYLTEKDLVDGCCPVHGTKPEIIEEENYFFRLSAYRDKLLAFYEENQDFVFPKERFNEVYSFVESGLEDISISRSKSKLAWGIEVPDDPDQVMYVWFDALTNYISAIGYSDDEKTFNEYWPADMHVIGKDISRFHCILWPAMLMSAGLPLPKKVFIHGFLTVEGEKMSKSKGNVVNPFEVISEFGSDALRYYLIAEVPTTEDGDFSRSRFIERYNSDLANDYGNSFYRMLKLALKNQIKILRKPEQLSEEDIRFIKEVDSKFSDYLKAMEALRLKDACQIALDSVRSVNKYIDLSAPWSVAKTDVYAFERILYIIFDALRRASIILNPVIPNASSKMFASMGVDPTSIKLEDAGSYGTVSQYVLNESEPLFPRIEKE
ncbi:MAG: methionine--tRNA ligase [Actinobacteria bacterium]|nr:methionine--tRNA ligase [Actinomycetota bacterium]